MKKLALLSLLLACTTAVQAQLYGAWSRYRTITVNTTATGGGANVAGTVTNFPVLVRLVPGAASTGANVLTEALAGGADVRFTDSTGNTDLAYQIDRWATTGAAIWVKVPSVTGNASTKIRMYWGRAGQASASNGAAVFDTAAGYTGVWHLDQDGGGTGNVLDATANALNFNGHASVPAVPGVVGNARHYNNDGSAFFVDDFTGAGNATKATLFQAAGAATNLTISTWVQPKVQSGQDIQGIFGHYRYNSSARSYMLSMGGTVGGGGSIRINRSANGTGDAVVESQGTPLATLNTWYHLVMTITGADAANNNIKVYVNGARLAMPNHATNYAYFTAPVAADAARPLIGAMETTYNHRFQGYIDELQFSRGVSRDSNWVKLSYETQKAGATAVTFGATISSKPLYYPFKNAVYILNNAIEANTPVVSGAVTGNYAVAPTTMPAGLSFNTTTGVISGTPTAVTAATQFIVTATVGGSPAADTLTIAVSAGDPPGAPTNVFVTGGNAQATVTWTAPSVSGTFPVTSYLVRAVNDTSKTCTWTTGALSCVVTGLTNGTSYTFVVRAVSSVGPGAFSTASPAITPAGVPGSPTAVTATVATSTSVLVAWTAPASNGGSPISDYYVTGAPGGQLCYSPPIASPSCTVTGLTAGTSYTFTVVAANSAGNSPASLPSNAVVPGGTGIFSGYAIRASGAAKPFAFALTPEAADATEALTMTISDTYGRTVWSQTVNPKRDGIRQIVWNGRSTTGRAVSAGVYMVRVSSVKGGATSSFIQKAVEQK